MVGHALFRARRRSPRRTISAPATIAWRARGYRPLRLPEDQVQPYLDNGRLIRVLEDWCRDDGVRAALTNSVAALGELLRGFNENIYASSGGSADN